MASAPSSNSLTSPPPPLTSSNSPPPSLSSPPPPPSNGLSSSPPPSSNNSSSSPPPRSSSSNDTKSSPPPPSKNNEKDGNSKSSYSPPPPLPRSSSSSRHSPPPRSLSHGSKKSSSNEDVSSGVTNILPIVIGVTVGIALMLILCLIACICSCKKKKKRTEYGFYSDQSPKANGGNFYNSQNQPLNSWQGGNQNDSSLPPPPGAYGGWTSQPQPPHTGQKIPSSGITSGDLSSNFSGPYGQALPPPHPSMALGFTQSSFSYNELAAATENFCQANLLGQGGFGYVHKGVLPNGKEIAVKSLKDGSGQGDREFQAEVEIISRVHHRHLVSLVGYCIAGGKRVLVYEFMPNSTLEFHLYGKGRPTMDWPTRIKIALGAAKGLAYLHEDCHPRIIHRDIKTANILLDYNFDAKVADFGLAKLSSETNTHVSTRVMGTFGYLAPEYASSGKLTEKSDVFSFGVMLLELITGRRPFDPSSDMDESLIDWARPICAEVIESGNFSQLADPMMEGNYDPAEMSRMVACAGAAVRHSARRRPKMSQIVRTLEGDVSLEHLDERPKPAGQSTAFNSSPGGSDYDTSSYNTDMKKYRKVAMEDSQEFPSSEYGHTSSEEMATKNGIAGTRHRV